MRKELSAVYLKVKRYRPELDAKPFYSEYRVDIKPSTTVNDALYMIKEKFDGSLSWRASCRMGICGSCGMSVNGRPLLACQTSISQLGTDRLVVEPLPNYPVIKDLVTEFNELYEKHRRIRPFIVRKDDKELNAPTREYSQTPRRMEDYLQFSYCIMCGLCNSACPVIPSDREFTGPQALAAAYRYVADSRDEGAGIRLRIVDGPHGAWRCHFAGACSEVCPRGVDPALGIQLLRREALARRLRLKRERGGASVAAVEVRAPRPGVPEAPPRTV
jgi:succinate dehydrogenase / fumarate reductase iron-sulfur subunit